MNFRLAELSRRFQDIIDHLTNKPFTWGQGDGTLSDQTDLQEALAEKANLEGGNVFDGTQSFLSSMGSSGQKIIRAISGNLSSGSSKIVLLGSMNTGRTRISGFITTSIGTTGGNRDCVTIQISSLVDVPTGSPTTQVSYSATQGHTSGEPIRLITCDYLNDPYLALQVHPGIAGQNRSPHLWYFLGSDYTQNEPNNLNLPIVLDDSSVSSISAFTAGNRGYLSESGTKVLDGNMTVNGTITADDFITQSRVASDEENALSALENLPEWLTPGGEIDYKKHYAYAPRLKKDEDGNIIEEKPGLSMEKRVAMLEKMMHEIYKEKLEEIKADQTQRIELIAQKLEAAGDLSQEIERKNIATEIRKVKNI